MVSVKNSFMAMAGMMCLGFSQLRAQEPATRYSDSTLEKSIEDSVVKKLLEEPVVKPFAIKMSHDAFSQAKGLDIKSSFIPNDYFLSKRFLPIPMAIGLEQVQMYDVDKILATLDSDTSLIGYSYGLFGDEQEVVSKADLAMLNGLYKDMAKRRGAQNPHLYLTCSSELNASCLLPLGQYLSSVPSNVDMAVIINTGALEWLGKKGFKYLFGHEVGHKRKFSLGEMFGVTMPRQRKIEGGCDSTSFVLNKNDPDFLDGMCEFFIQDRRRTAKNHPVISIFPPRLADESIKQGYCTTFNSATSSDHPYDANRVKGNLILLLEEKAHLTGNTADETRYRTMYAQWKKTL
jgi:hypothetical protein